LELVGLIDDGKMLERLNFGPMYQGLSLVWDVTIVVTFGHAYATIKTAPFCRHRSNRGWSCEMSNIQWSPSQ